MAKGSDNCKCNKLTFWSWWLLFSMKFWPTGGWWYTSTSVCTVCSHLKKFILWKLSWLPSYSSFTKIEIKAKSFPRGAENNMLWFIYHFFPTLLCVFMAQTPIPLTGQQVWQIILPHQGMKYLQKLCFDHVFLLLSRDAHLCTRCQWRPTDGMVTSSICSRFPSSVFICSRKELHESRSSQEQTCKMFFVSPSSNFSH